MELTDILANGDVGNLSLQGNIRYEAAPDSASGMFLRLGSSGLTELYRAPNQDVEWTDTNANNIAITTSAQELLSVTIDQDVTSNDGSYKILGILTNSANQDRIITVNVYDDATLVGTQDIHLDKSTYDKPFIFSGGIENTFASGSSIRVEFIADGSSVELLGSTSPSELTIIKAQAAPVQMSVDNGTLFRTTSNLGNTLSRVEILGVIGTERPKSFGIIDSNSRGFMVNYDSDMDKFYYERLTEAT